MTGAMEAAQPNDLERDQMRRFEETWKSPPGYKGWLSAVNNQPLGRRFMMAAFVFFLLGGVLGLLIRLQLAVSDNTVLGPQVYNQIFTMHGSTMMYLFAVPFLEGLAVYLLPLLIGSRDLAFPRLTAFGWWTYLFGGIVFFASFLFGTVPDAGWFAYTPLSNQQFSGKGQDFFLLALALVEVAGITAGIEIVVTVLKLRAPGMALSRMPMFAWAILTAGVMILFAFTVLLLATLLLEMDRTLGTHFFNADRGGNNLLWQHLFWFFGHPEVYIIFIPATGIVSMVIAAFAKRLAGYTWITVAIILTGFLSFGLWVHHMYTTGLPELSMHFFAAASLMIALASGTQIFAWIASLWGSRPELRVPLLYVLGFFFIFVIGGMTGVMVAVVPFDRQVHDTFFIVAHFHYVLIGGALFPILAGLSYWLPKITGRMLDERLGRWAFGLVFIGFNLTFFPMHIMGLLGMPRRVYTYPAMQGLDGYNLLATGSAFVFAIGILLFAWNYLWSRNRGTPAGDNPWQADSLEWSVSSPPPIYGFLQPPVVTGRHPLWETETGAALHPESAVGRASGALRAAPVGWRATLSTDVLTAEPQGIHYLSGPSYAPLAAAAGMLVALCGVLFEFYIVAAAGTIFTVGAFIQWLWPSEERLALIRASGIDKAAGVPVFAMGTRSAAWWGMACGTAVGGTVIATLTYCYFYLRLFSPEWPQDGIRRPDLWMPSGTFGLLTVTSLTQWFGSRCLARGAKRQARLFLGSTLVVGLASLVLHIHGLSRVPFSIQMNAYGSVFLVTAWVFNLFLIVALGLQFAAQLRLRRNFEDRAGFTGLQLQITGMLWFFIVAAGIMVYLVLYVSPHVL